MLNIRYLCECLKKTGKSKRTVEGKGRRRGFTSIVK